MHPVLASAVHPFAEEIAAASLAEAQISPDPEFHRWCAQGVVEHLILSFQKSRLELQKRLKSSESPSGSSTFSQWVLKKQVCWFGSMPYGVPASHTLYPRSFVPQAGQELAPRLLSEAKDLSDVLAACRIAFGLRPCGSHPIYGPLRVEEWRVYHAVHCRHHIRQFKEAIAFARTHPLGRATSMARMQPTAVDPGHPE